METVELRTSLSDENLQILNLMGGVLGGGSVRQGRAEGITGLRLSELQP